MFKVRSIAWLLALPLAAAFSDAAKALPAYAAQTAQPCQACHIGGFGPQLTPFGREFKLNGYAMRAGEGFNVPVSAMAIASFVNTAKDQSAPPAKNYGTNNNFTIDQVNLFLAGGIGDHFGGFAQFTYDGVGRGTSWDNLDLRAVDRVTVWDSDVLVGLSLNNNPTVQDVWNTTPAWGFPYTTSTLAPSPGAGPLIAGGFAGKVLGLTAYAWWDSHIYTEAGIYWTPGNGFLRTLGASADTGVIEGAAPYFRLAYEQDYGVQNFTVGAFGLFPNLHPPGVGGTATDDYDDIGIDATYVYMGDSSNVYALNARFTHEEQNLDASFGAGNSAKPHDSLEDIRFDASYYWHNTIGVTVSPFDTWGSTDTLLYAGNSTFRPNSTGVMLQADYTLFPNSDSPLGERFNMRVGIQYTAYTQFNGAGTNFDGAGTNASDNNTLRIFTWLAY
jgi:hypothetical protein